MAILRLTIQAGFGKHRLRDVHADNFTCLGCERNRRRIASKPRRETAGMGSRARRQEECCYHSQEFAIQNDNGPRGECNLRAGLQNTLFIYIL